MKKKLQTMKSIYEYYDDESSTGVEFRRLAKKLKSYGNPKEIKSILVTSAIENEGKSLITSNLGIAMAIKEKDKNILILDCDLRKPTIHSLFNIRRSPGLASLLDGSSTFNDGVINDTELANLKIITSGHHVNAITHLFEGIKDVIEECKELFDMVICDSSPVVPIDDASMIAPCLDGVLLVVKAGKTDKNVVKRAVEILSSAKANIFGIALNNVNGALPYYYDYGYYGYNYVENQKQWRFKHK